MLFYLCIVKNLEESSGVMRRKYVTNLYFPVTHLIAFVLRVSLHDFCAKHNAIAKKKNVRRYGGNWFYI